MFKRAYRSIQRFVYWLGTGRSQALFILLALTGLISLMLNAVQKPTPEWVPLVQTYLAVGFLVGAMLIIVTRFTGQERFQVLLMVGPATGALALGVIFPQIFLGAVVVAAGWLVIAPITARSRVRREYQSAIKAMRKGDYDEAIKVMNTLIKAEPQQSDHYRFRAEIWRLSGKPRRARSDYEKVAELTPQSGVGFNGLAEVYLQEGEFEQARTYALQALERETMHWVAAYNLGMIEERLEMWSESVEHLKKALDAGIPDSRHRLLAYLWMTRAYLGKNQRDEAEKALASLKREKTGLREWKTIFEAKEAEVLRIVLLPDVQLAESLAEEQMGLDDMVETPTEKA